MTPIEAIQAFLAAFDRKRKIRPWLTGGAYIEVIHADDCYKETAVCGCGGFEQRNQVFDAIEGFRAVLEGSDPFKTIKHPAPPVGPEDLP